MICTFGNATNTQTLVSSSCPELFRVSTALVWGILKACAEGNWCITSPAAIQAQKLSLTALRQKQETGSGDGMRWHASLCKDNLIPESRVEGVSEQGNRSSKEVFFFSSGFHPR